MRPKRVAIVFGVLGFLGLGFHWCRTEGRIDECIDTGGRWDGKECSR